MEKIYSGKVLEELKALAYTEITALGVKTSDITIEVIEEPVKKLFGKKGDYKIRVTYPEVTTDEVTATAPVATEPVAEASETAPAQTDKEHG